MGTYVEIHDFDNSYWYREIGDSKLVDYNHGKVGRMRKHTRWNIRIGSRGGAYVCRVPMIDSSDRRKHCQVQSRQPKLP